MLINSELIAISSVASIASIAESIRHCSVSRTTASASATLISGVNPKMVYGVRYDAAARERELFYGGERGEEIK